MAGGKQTPRQKMINLMYLVFIAMMALNMSKEVLTAFGMMDEKFASVNKSAEQNNEKLLQALAMKADDEPARYSESNRMALEVQKLSKSFYDYLGTLQADAIEGFKIDEETGKLPYEQMDKGQGIDYGWFIADKLTPKGEEIKARFKKYRDEFKAVLGNDTKYQFLLDEIDRRFNTNNVKTKDGIEKEFLDYHFKGYPAIASKAKLSSFQNDVKELENEAYNLFLGNSLKQAASMKNYQAMVFTDKSVYFAGEPIKGKVGLIRYDKSTVPTEVVVNGTRINLSNANAFSDGQVNINTVAGGLGEHKFTGHFTFMEDGQPVKVDILASNYVVVARPNTATIAADRMNVVYMGVDNPISASFAGISSDKVTVTASSGSLRKTGDGKYILQPAQAKEVVITATGVLPDGKSVSDKKVFRIKPIPKPFGTIRGEYAAKGPVSNLKQVSVGAKFEDFEFDVNLQVTEFTIIFPGGLGSDVINGTRLTESAQRKAERLKPGDIVRITGIKTKISGLSIPTKPASDATFTIQ